jgi:hypothetical protein
MSLNSRFHPCTYFKHGNSEVEVFSYDTELENCWFKLNRNSKITMCKPICQIVREDSCEGITNVRDSDESKLMLVQNMRIRNFKELYITKLRTCQKSPG